ncbi:uridine diphosphate glucose pyrophosphatase NUDT14-like [Bradysia coprophila]|uniref:uridine diphosphate glucose pyrophosphatase NUDT14-like n=1 Tax=Bradysia coprophila TaxID=38358 RepID=UPI00187DD70F|nr:uridine diphosphate glucose pyrophosphatase NUDT14-like [Bradysia coprophila]
MDNITNVRCGAMPENSGLLKTFRMYYVQNNVKKDWDLVQVDDTISVIIYNKTTEKLIFEKRFEPVVLYDETKKFECKSAEDAGVKYPAELGFTVQLCTRTVDKDLPLNEIAQEQIERMCGYKISVDRIEQAMTYRSDVGAAGAEETLFYCEVTNADKIGKATGVDSDDKFVEIVEMSIQEVEQMVARIANDRVPPTCLMGMFWFLRNKAAARH